MRNSCSSHTEEIIIYDDDYYIEIGSEPPRFLAYRQARAKKWALEVEAGEHKPSDYDPSVTQDELDFRLKSWLKTSPEHRYQIKKENRFFHELGSYMRALSIDDYDKGCHDQQCIPECPFYPEYGRIEDQEVIEEHNKLVESLRQKNAIVEPPSEDELLKLAKIYHFS